MLEETIQSREHSVTRRVIKWILVLVVVIEIFSILKVSALLFQRPSLKASYASLVTNNLGGTWQISGATGTTSAFSGIMGISDDGGSLQGTANINDDGDKVIAEVSGHIQSENEIFINLLLSGTIITVIGKLKTPYEITGSFTLNNILSNGTFDITFYRNFDTPTSAG